MGVYISCRDDFKNSLNIMKETITQSEANESEKVFTYALVDPRPIPEAQEANEKLFQNPHGVLGIELTIPAYAERCTLGNIDPQHSGENPNLAAVEVAVNHPIPPTHATFATVRADLDALGSMAILKYRANGGEITPDMQNRIQIIAESDKFNRGGWPGKSTFPSSENPWPTSGGATESKPLAAIASHVMDFKVPVETRVKSVEDFLLTGAEPTEYRTRVENERADMIAALESGAIKVEMVANDKVAFVESTHRAGTSIGYTQAPVVVALNPMFKQGPGEPYKKYTIAQYENGHIDLIAVKNELAALETGWGGSPTIIGSPQGVSSNLTAEQVIEVVSKHLKR